MRRALTRALPMLFDARLLARIALPLAALTLAWLVVGFFTWSAVTGAIARLFGGDDPGAFSAFSANVIATLLWFAGVLVSNLLLVAIIAMPVIVRVVAARDFQDLHRLHGGTFAGSLANAVVSLGVFVAIWLVSLLALPLPPVFLFLSLANAAWLNSRLFRYDALAEHADRAELRKIIGATRGRMFLLGLCLAPLSLIPLVNFVAPLYAGIAFAYLALEELARRRRYATTVGHPR